MARARRRLLILGMLAALLPAWPTGAQDFAGPGPAAAIGEYAGEPAGGAGVKLISGVPCYFWYNGCGPTSSGMIIGYWDAHGYSNLIPGSNDWVANEQAVKDMIASPGHIRDYVPTRNRTPTPEDPWHANDCVADWFQCSKNPDNYGWAYFSYADDSLRDYAIYRGYTTSAVYNLMYASSLWDTFTAAIDNNHPVEFLVDSDGNGSTDHFVAAVGYDNTPGAYRYACWDTWYATVRWCDYKALGGGAWGVYGGTFFNPAPEPASLMLLGAGAFALLRRRRLAAGRG